MLVSICACGERFGGASELSQFSIRARRSPTPGQKYPTQENTKGIIEVCLTNFHETFNLIKFFIPRFIKNKISKKELNPTKWALFFVKKPDENADHIDGDFKGRFYDS